MRSEQDAEQVQRVRAKLDYLKQNFPHLVQLDRPVPIRTLRDLEDAQEISLPWDFCEVLSKIAGGGLLPPFLSERYWRPLLYRDWKTLRLGQPFPLNPSEKPTDYALDASELPGQLPLMGDGTFGWSLITAGPYQGEVWTLGSFGGTRVPGCSFSQWLELVLDGNLGAYIAFRVTGKEEDVSFSRRLLDLLQAGPVWKPDENPKELCARWLDRHRKPLPQPAAVPENGETDDGFVYIGPSPNNWAGYLKDQLRATLRPLPEECDLELAALRAAQRSRGWLWGRRPQNVPLTSAELKRQMIPNRVRWEDSGEVQRLAQIIRTIQEQGVEALLPIPPEDEPLLYQALKLTKEKSFGLLSSGVRDLSFLQGLTNLKELTLRNNDIEDLSPLASLSGLRELNLPFNLISDLTPLAGLEKLVKLRLYGNRISCLEPLRGLTSLNQLNLRGNPLEPGALACLRKCKRIGMLDLSCTSLGDISGLEFCRVHVLELQGNPDLTGLEVLSSMKRLCCLYLDADVAHRYDIPRLAPQLIEYAELNGLAVYTWPEKYYN